MKQTASQKAKANTSLNHIPALFKKLDWSKVTVNLDWGGGKYVKGTEYLAEKDVENIVYDKYNQTAKKQKAALDRAYHTQIDCITCSNVLNVIKSKAERTKLLKHIWLVICCQSREFNNLPFIHFTMYEKNGDGKPDEDLPQTNMRTDKYLPEITANFPDSFEISMLNKVISLQPITYSRYQDNQSIGARE